MINLSLVSFTAVLVFGVTYRYYENHYIALHPAIDLKCERVLDGIAHGPEDLAHSLRHQVFFVSSHNRRVMSSVGTIFAIDSSTGFATDIHMPSIPRNFRPHGISLYEDDVACTLFVISHRWELHVEHAIEVFNYYHSTKTLLHIQTLSSPLLTALNDLFALNSNELFVSNDHCDSNILRQLWHDTFGQACAETVWYHQTEGAAEWRSLGDKVRFGNGIIVKKGDLYSDEFVIRSASASYELYNFTLSRLDSLTLKTNHIEKLPLSPDNIEHDTFSGGLLIAGHPSVARFILNSIFEVPAPSAVILYFGQNDYRVIYYSNGSELSASSVAIRTNESTYFLGQVFDSFVLRCNI